MHHSVYDIPDGNITLPLGQRLEFSIGINNHKNNRIRNNYFLALGQSWMYNFVLYFNAYIDVCL